MTEPVAQAAVSGPATGVRLDVLHTADIAMPRGYVFRAAGNRVSQLRAGLNRKGPVIDAPCLAYVVRHPEAGVLLIDTGFHPQASTDLRREFGPVMGFLFSGLRPAQASFAEQLRAFGVEPDEVTRVVMTHLHVDHTSGMRLLPNATFICARREWAAAHRRLAAANGYVSHHLPPAARTQLLDFARQAEPWDVFPSTVDLLGDGSVRLISTPGHTAGHQSVLLALADGRSALLVGDAAYTVRSIHEQVLPMFTADDAASRESLRQLNAFATQHPEAILVPTHDPQAWRGLPGAG